MECKVVSKNFKLVAQKGNALYVNFGLEVPKAAQQLLVRKKEIENCTETEIAIFEPKKTDDHLEGEFYVGMIVTGAPAETPLGLHYIELNHDYVSTKGNIKNLENLHSYLLNWTIRKGYKRNLDAYIVETYHLLEDGAEEVGIYLPIQA
ncbi:AraC family transcriptional regulator [Fictibacillus barbaricus]|uniref:Transcriptional regulator YdeE n=1 Tax=Fictibacillus barbaricus TaxID=182136 RepID=A0ABU1TWN0_9BACL|nr:AraC family transcriptional regulator [Fictibacillus barbaricus]MDR7071618.1 putative transcriptional regulator YdeE [Fictibacillus barbaricus]